MSGIAEAIRHTPVWVWPVVLIFLWLGARNLRGRERLLASFYILPAALLVLALNNLAASRADLTIVIPAFFVSLLIGAGIGWNLVPRGAAAIRGTGRVRVPGSVAPLLIVIAAILLRYAIGYIYGRWPALRADPALALEFSATGALLAGIVWGRVARLTWLYRKA